MNNFSATIASYDNPILKSINYYITDEKWGKIEYSTTFLLRKIVEVSICCIVLAIAMLNKSNTRSSYNNLIILTIGICFLFIDYKTFFERFFLILNFLFISLYFFKKKIRLLDLLLLAIMFIYFISINLLVYGKNFTYEHNEIIPDSKTRYSIQLKPYYYPSILLLDINNGYSDEYISTHSTWGKFSTN